MFNYVRLAEKVASLGYDSDIVGAVYSLGVALDRRELTPEQESIVLELFSVNGKEKLARFPDGVSEASWEDFNYGNVKIGDFVRVKKDAYDSETGSKHNGLVGILVHMRAGRCSVDYLGEESGRSMRHAMNSLESLRWV